MEKMKRRWSMRETFLLLFLAVALLPLGFSAGMLYRQTGTWANELLLHNTGIQMQINRQRVETMLSSVEKSLALMVDDTAMRDLMDALATEDASGYLERQREFGEIAAKYFDADSALLGVELVTPLYTISWADRLGISKDQYHLSYIVKDLNHTFGKIKWYGTYNVASMFKSDKVSQVGAETQTAFTAGQRILWNSGNKTLYLILMVHLRPSIFKTTFETDNLFSDTVYMVVDNYENVIYENTPSFFFTHKYDLLKRVYSNIEDQEAQIQDGTVLNFASIDRLGWKILSATPTSGVVQYFWQRLLLPTAVLGILCLGIAALAAALFSRCYFKPLKKLAGALDGMADGDLEAPLPAPRAVSREFQEVFAKYGAMHQNIRGLIRKNSDSALREKELELQVLNLQYNPHFLYNTLNSINLLAIAYGQAEISEMLTDLSAILRYSVNVKENIVKFSEDFAYIKSYIALMRTRYDNQFTFVSDIQPEVFEQRIPKFILQPLIENAILHGMQGMSHSVTIRLSAAIANEEIIFTLHDDGRGMDAQDDPAGHGSMIGLSNTTGRLQFYYGDNYSLQVESGKDSGTTIAIRLSAHIL